MFVSSEVPLIPSSSISRSSLFLTWYSEVDNATDVGLAVLGLASEIVVIDAVA